ncbi:MAG: YgjP-like metallopeptidase domain-containing protein, partial [Pseudomonadota bacterium]
MSIGARHIPVEVRKSHRARRLSLTADTARGVVRLTIPARAAYEDAARFLDSRKGWLGARLNDLPVACPFAPGARFPLEGSDVVIRHRPAAPREPVLGDGVITVGGPSAFLNARIDRWLRRRADVLLTAETAEFARRIDREATITQVRVRDTRRQWGSCAPAHGRFSYSWRL